EAEGIKQAQILAAEGRRQKDILEAQGEAQARVLRAEAEAEAIKKVAEAAESYFKDKAQAYKKLEVSQQVLTGSTKWILPANSELVNVLNVAGESSILPLKKPEAKK
ncbi:MAG: Band 7 protein, partial [Candidatus Gottesmanbacteria bacterium GW2011_GWC2_39_8]